jgi:hypothetical protein
MMRMTTSNCACRGKTILNEILYHGDNCKASPEPITNFEKETKAMPTKKKNSNGNSAAAPRKSNLLPAPRFVKDLPGQTRARSSEYINALKPLVKHRNKWAIIAEFQSARHANGIASYLRKDPKALPGSGRFEFSTRTIDDQGVLFAKYLG